MERGNLLGQGMSVRRMSILSSSAGGRSASSWVDRIQNQRKMQGHANTKRRQATTTRTSRTRQAAPAHQKGRRSATGHKAKHGTAQGSRADATQPEESKRERREKPDRRWKRHQATGRRRHDNVRPYGADHAPRRRGHDLPTTCSTGWPQ